MTLARGVASIVQGAVNHYNNEAMPRARRTAAIACIALVVFAAFLPLGGASLEWLVVTPVFTLLPSSATSVALREEPRGDERLVALLAILESRGPPSHSSLA